MSEPFIGEIRMFGGNFAPSSWAFCIGSLLPISENDALFSLIGTTYGGDGQSTFALPDLRGRLPMHRGSGPGLTPRTIGETGGNETVTLLASQMPAHTHAVPAQAGVGTETAPGVPATPASQIPTYAAGGASAMDPTGLAGAGLPAPNVPPFLTTSFIISLYGIYPSRP